MGDILNLQVIIGRGGRDEKIEDSVGIICEGIRMSYHISRNIALLDLQAKESTDKIKCKALSKTVFNKAELQTIM